MRPATELSPVAPDDRCPNRAACPRPRSPRPNSRRAGPAPEPAAAGPADPLTRLKGLGPKAEAALNELGITRFEQIASWSENDVARIDQQMGAFKGRMARDRWIEQARYLAAGDSAGFEATFGKLGESAVRRRGLASSLSIRRPSMSTTSKRQPPIGEVLAGLRQMLRSTDSAKPGDGRIVAVLGQIDAEPLGQRIGRDRARDQQAAVLALDERGVVARRR